MNSIFFSHPSHSAARSGVDTYADTEQMSTSFDSQLDAQPHPAERVSAPVDLSVTPHTHRRAWAAGIAFFTTVFASMAAAATVANSDFPLMIVGL